MTNKKFTKDVIQRYADHHRAFQAVVSIVSNHRIGIDVGDKDFVPRAIYKTEGGVVVNNRDIVVDRNVDGSISCYNEYDEDDKDTAEVVRTVVEEMLSIKSEKTADKVLLEYAIKNTNVPEEILGDKIFFFPGSMYAGNDLSHLFET